MTCSTRDVGDVVVDGTSPLPAARTGLTVRSVSHPTTAIVSIAERVSRSIAALMMHAPVIVIAAFCGWAYLGPRSEARAEASRGCDATVTARVTASSRQ